VSGTIREIVHESEPDMVPTQPDDMSDGMGVCGGGFALAAGLAGQVLLALRLRLRLPWPGPP
jgi:hypothetical protein